MSTVRVVTMKAKTTKVTVSTEKTDTVIIEIGRSGEIDSSGPEGGPTSNQPDAAKTKKDEQKEKEEQKAQSQNQEAEPEIEEQHADHLAGCFADPRFF